MNKEERIKKKKFFVLFWLIKFYLYLQGKK
jgi:hypothetical protein